MNTESSPVPAAAFLSRDHTAYDTSPAPAVWVEPLSVKLRRALDVEDDHDILLLERIPQNVRSAGMAIAGTIRDMEEAYHMPFGFEQYLTEPLQRVCAERGLKNMYLEAGRLARDILEERDLRRFSVSEKYRTTYRPETEFLYDPEIWHSIKDIEHYVTNNDALVVIPKEFQQEFATRVRTRIEKQIMEDNFPDDMPKLKHRIFPFGGKGLTILETAFNYGNESWNNYTILMDAGYDLRHDYRNGPQFSDYENLTLLSAYEADSDDVVHVLTNSWYLHRRRDIDPIIRIECPTGYPSVWEWFNTVTRMAYQYHRRLQTNNYENLTENIPAIIHPDTLNGLAADFERLMNTKTDKTTNPEQKKNIIRQMGVMLEKGGNAPIVLFDRLGALRHMVCAFGGDPDKFTRPLSKQIIDISMLFDYSRPSTNVQIFIASLKEYAWRTTGTKSDVLPDLEGLIYMMDVLNGGFG